MHPPIRRMPELGGRRETARAHRAFGQAGPIGKRAFQGFVQKYYVVLTAALRVVLHWKRSLGDLCRRIRYDRDVLFLCQRIFRTGPI